MTRPIEPSRTDPNHRRPLVTETALYPLSEFSPEEAAKLAEFEAAPTLPEAYRPAPLVALLDQLDELRAKATPGPWNAKQNWIDMGVPDNSKTLLAADGRDLGDVYLYRPGEDNAALIVAAVNAVGPLAEIVRAVTEVARWCEEQAESRSHYAKVDPNYRNTVIPYEATAERLRAALGSVTL